MFVKAFTIRFAAGVLFLVIICLHSMRLPKQFIGPAACGAMAGMLVFAVRRQNY